MPLLTTSDEKHLMYMAERRNATIRILHNENGAQPWSDVYIDHPLLKSSIRITPEALEGPSYRIKAEDSHEYLRLMLTVSAMQEYLSALFGKS